MYIYIKSEPKLWTVGIYDPWGKWHSESDHNSSESAAARVHYLNGGDEEYPDPESIVTPEQQRDRMIEYQKLK